VTLVIVATFWFLFALAAGSLIGKHFDLLGPPEAEQEGALGNATGAPGVDKARRPQVLTVQQLREDSCSSAVVELDGHRIRRANRGSAA
jgi:hypothetical protein